MPRLIIDIVGDTSKLTRSFRTAERETKTFQSRMGGIVGGRGGAAAIVGGSLVLLGRQAVQASRDAQVIIGQTSIAVKDAGLSWRQYAGTVEDASKRISDASAFDDEVVLQSFQVFVRGQKDVQKSLRLTELAADVARQRYIDLDQATQLVNKAAMGQVGALRRAGIMIDKNATAAEALDYLYESFHGSAKEYADSAVGSSEKLHVAWENLAEQAGGPLSDSLAVLAGELTTVVGLMEKAAKVKPFGGFGGSIGTASAKSAMSLIPGLGPLVALGAALGIGGGGGPKTPGGTGMGGVGSVYDAIMKALGGAGDAVKAASAIRTANSTVDDLVGFIGKWTDAGKKFGDAQKAAEAAAAAREALFGRLQLGVERTGLTDTLQDDLKALQNYQRTVKNIIATEGSTLELQQTLLGIEVNIKGVQDEIAANRKAAAAAAKASAAAAAETAAAARKAAVSARVTLRNQAQFLTLGLTAEGDEKAPGVKALRRQAQQLTKALHGTLLDTKGNRSILKGIRRVLSGELGEIGRMMRLRIQDMIDNLNSQLDGVGKKKGPRRVGGITVDKWGNAIGPGLPSERHVPSIINRFTGAVEDATAALNNFEKLRIFADLKQFGGNLWSRAGTAAFGGRVTSPGSMGMPRIQRGTGQPGMPGIFGGGGRHTSGTVVVNQHFNAPTTDRHREARYAMVATRAVFDT